MKKWIIVSWDTVDGKGTALGEFSGTYDDAATHVRENWLNTGWSNLTLCGVIEAL